MVKVFPHCRTPPRSAIQRSVKGPGCISLHAGIKRTKPIDPSTQPAFCSQKNHDDYCHKQHKCICTTLLNRQLKRRETKVQSHLLPDTKNDFSVCESQTPKASKGSLQLIFRNTYLCMSLLSDTVNKVLSKLRNSLHHPEYSIILAMKFWR